jgi:hypothetical protein
MHARGPAKNAEQQMQRNAVLHVWIVWAVGLAITIAFLYFGVI